MNYKLLYLAKRNPSIKLEEWPRTWRSHAVFASQFPPIGAPIDTLFYCSRVIEPKLNEAAYDPPGASLNYDGVAVVSGASADAFRAEYSPDLRAKVDQDELRVFSTLTPNFSFHCKELLVHGGAPGQAAVICFLTRTAGGSQEAFNVHWNGRFADRAKRAVDASGAVVRYVHNGLTREPPPGYPFDGIVEVWFAHVDDAVRSFVDGWVASVSQDLRAICDVERSVTLLTKVIHRWPRT
jgi:hypothetical protein